MAENKKKIYNDNFITIQGWMINDLQLKGNELIIYSIIYGFSQAENQVYSGSLQYLADWTNSTKQGVMKNLKSLLDKGLISKNDKYLNGVKFCEYYTTKFNGVLNKVSWGIKQSLTNNIDNNINNNIDNKESKKEKEPVRKKTSSNKTNYDDIISEIIKNDNVKETVYEFIKMRKLIKKPLTDRALTMILNKLKKFTQNEEEQIEILNRSIINNWQDIYEIKKQQQNSWIDKEVKEEKIDEEERQKLDSILEKYK